MRKPDFFIVGAPKCGTTALYEWLREHPEIFVPERKEIHYFGTDLYSPSYLRDTDKYLDLFAEAHREQRIGEASVWYLFSQVASREIKSFSPDAQIIIMLRNPVDMIYSLHSQRLYLGSENVDDFEVALNLENERKNGSHLPANPYPVAGLQYREVGRYADQVKRYLDTFSGARVKVIIYDDFKTDPARVCAETFDFLGVSPIFEPKIRVINPNKRVRSKAIRAVLDAPPPPLIRKLVRPLTSPAMRHRLFATLRSLNTEYLPRPPLRAELRQQLQADFAPDVERLSQLLDRDLTGWCRM
jgi:hypothetical protein